MTSGRRPAASGCRWDCGGRQGLQMWIAAGGKWRTAGVLCTTTTASCPISRSPPSTNSGSVASAPPPSRSKEPFRTAPSRRAATAANGCHRWTSRLQVLPGLQALRYDALLAGSHWFRVIRGGVEACCNDSEEALELSTCCC